MKKLLYVIAVVLCLTACEKSDPTTPGGSTTKGDYVDLGLASGTLWKTQNEELSYDYYNLFDYKTAVAQFGDNMPTKEQWEELKAYCHWEWNGFYDGYKITGPNGKTITLPPAGFRSGSNGQVNAVGQYGFYWSSTLDTEYENYVWFLNFASSYVNVDRGTHSDSYSVRLVRKK
ncbi:MAG: hypothetical protein IJS82_04495 [Paludibacteraceae bacterium]|nr:hypothetical protein [Paludibacteraceae bacterium]